MRSSVLVSAVISATMGLGCALDQVSSVSEEPTSPPLVISDAAHSAGKRHFFFLPPLVPQPTPTGPFDAGLEPVVEICTFDAECGQVVARFTTTSGTGGATVDVDVSAQQYRVNWDTRTCEWGPCTLNPTADYRLEIRAAGVLLGFADLDVVATGTELRHVQSGETIGLLNGRTLPIRFRVEQGVVASLSIVPNPATVPIGGQNQLVADVRDLHGSPVAGGIVTWQIADVSLAAVTGGGLVTGIAGGCTTVTAALEDLFAEASLIVTPTPPDLAVLRDDGLYVMDEEGCDARRLIAGAVIPNTGGWSPDGSEFALALNDGTGAIGRINVVRADGSSSRVLPISGRITGHGYNSQVSWSPDGLRLVFAAIPPGGIDHEIFVMNADGTDEQQITFAPVSSSR